MTCNNTQTNTIGADFARIQCELESIRFHAERLKELTGFIISADPVFEPRIVAADQLARHVLNAIDNLPALYAAPVVEVAF